MRKERLLLLLILVAVVSLGIYTWLAGMVEPPQHIAMEEDKEHTEHDRHEEEGHEQGEHGEHGEHDENGHEEEGPVRMSPEELREFGVEVGRAGPGRLRIYLELPGEVRANPDRLAHIVSRVPGIVREVRKNLGDRVRAGEVMAVIDSRNLADAKSRFLAARERLKLAEANFKREKRLWERKISPEKEYLRAKKELAEARIELRASEQRLHALGFSDEYLRELPEHPETSFTRYEITAPFDGTVVEKHVTMGEAIKDDTTIFVVADLSSVWINLNVYQNDIPLVHVGQEVVISTKDGVAEESGRITYISPTVDERTRTVTARVELPNPDGIWKPGLFVTGRILVDTVDVDVAVPRTALQVVEGKMSVFVKTEEGFVPTPVVTGRKDEHLVEILSGLSPGTEYVTKGAFALKAELSKAEFSGGHAH